MSRYSHLNGTATFRKSLSDDGADWLRSVVAVNLQGCLSENRRLLSELCFKEPTENYLENSGNTTHALKNLWFIVPVNLQLFYKSKAADYAMFDRS